MAKDPAFLFYYQDFLVGTDEFTNEEVGAYIRCLCHQAHKGFVSLKHCQKLAGQEAVFEVVRTKFKSNGKGNLHNERLRDVMEKRSKYIKSRVKNLGGKSPT